jgi:hypothetical protein
MKARAGSESRQPEAEKAVGLRSGLWASDATTHGVVSERQHNRRAVRAFVEKPTGAAEVLRAIPQRKRGPVRILGVPVEAATGRCPGIEEEEESGTPEQRESTQSRGHGGGEKVRMVCCGGTGTEGLEVLIKFRTQSPCFKEKSLKVLRKEALSELYFWK